MFSKECYSYILGIKNIKKYWEIFWEMELSSPKLKKLLIFLEWTCKAWNSKISHIFFTFFARTFQTYLQKKNASDTFPRKEAKFSELKHFLIIIIRHFFSLYNIFFYAQKAFLFHLLINFRDVHDHIVFFFFFFFRKILVSFSSFFFFCSSLFSS